MDPRPIPTAQKTSALVLSNAQENLEPIDALDSASKTAVNIQGVKSFSAQDTSASKFRRALHCIDSNRPRPTLSSARRALRNLPSQSHAYVSVDKKNQGPTSAPIEPNETTAWLMTDPISLPAALNSEAKAPMSVDAQSGEQDNENLAWMDMMLALLEKRYGSDSSLPICLTDLEAANLFQLPQKKRLKKGFTPIKSIGSLDTMGGCSRANDSEMSAESAKNLQEVSVHFDQEQEMARQIKRQQVLLRHAHQIQASSGSSSTSCGCKTGCLKMYCMCFSSRGFCHAACTCDNCKNDRKYPTGRVEAIQNYLKNDPRAFSFATLSQDTSTSGILHLLPQKSSAVVMRGCRCKKSKCLKKYCECFQNAIACTSQCRCMQCSNHSESKAAHQHPHLYKCSVSSGSYVSSATNAKSFHPVHITVTKQPRRNQVAARSKRRKRK